ncbi:cellulose biosynthesis cyclic di-GMP-binding regulatory protein BcsB [Oceanotoga teriensis]|uniref:cellulose biosynthesis cyclic di-GMP-binding regulatory protein BcsB n=1 Tax=Oceanotoga teriensis TaxID=515440 RepID=UPI002713DCE8|nr:cellulose biosynthesis cyclic di-GMP-binding regulatory protein BcsB [Oceanotoga teriensis]MDO7977267.1 cellulose biosynthesis cyclic di-GMP-binding regulatory protein BcsB [Oceanotoga teriensis]
MKHFFIFIFIFFNMIVSLSNFNIISLEDLNINNDVVLKNNQKYDIFIPTESIFGKYNILNIFYNYSETTNWKSTINIYLNDVPVKSNYIHYSKQRIIVEIDNKELEKNEFLKVSIIPNLIISETCNSQFEDSLWIILKKSSYFVFEEIEKISIERSLKASSLINNFNFLISFEELENLNLISKISQKIGFNSRTFKRNLSFNKNIDEEFYNIIVSNNIKFKDYEEVLKIDKNELYNFLEIDEERISKLYLNDLISQNFQLKDFHEIILPLDYSIFLLGDFYLNLNLDTSIKKGRQLIISIFKGNHLVKTENFIIDGEEIHFTSKIKIKDFINYGNLRLIFEIKEDNLPCLALPNNYIKINNDSYISTTIKDYKVESIKDFFEIYKGDLIFVVSNITPEIYETIKNLSFFKGKDSYDLNNIDVIKYEDYIQDNNKSYIFLLEGFDEIPKNSLINKLKSNEIINPKDNMYVIENLKEDKLIFEVLNSEVPQMIIFGNFKELSLKNIEKIRSFNGNFGIIQNNQLFDIDTKLLDFVDDSDENKNEYDLRIFIFVFFVIILISVLLLIYNKTSKVD